MQNVIEGNIRSLNVSITSVCIALAVAPSDWFLCFVFRCLHDLASPLFCTYFQLTANTGQASRDDRRITRGQEQRLLQVPFLPGSSGRQSLTFVGSTLWNALPSDIRLRSAAFAFFTNRAELNGATLYPVLCR